MVTKPMTNTVELARELAQNGIATNAAKTDSTASFPEASIKALGESGLLGLMVPKAHGGKEATIREFVDTVSEIAASCASTGMIFVMHCCATHVIKNTLDDDAAAPILRDIAAGKHLTTLACSERGTGTHFYASHSTSKKEDGKYLLSGEKCFVTSARYADSYVLSTQAAENGGPLATSFYLVEKSDKGYEFQGDWNGLGLRGNESCVLKLNDCAVPADRVLGEEGAGVGFAIATILPLFLIGTAAVYTGIARAAYEASCAHVKDRHHKHTGDALADLQTIRRSIADMKVSVHSTKAFIDSIADIFDESPETPDLLIQLMEAKLLSTKTVKEVTMNAMQVCGGIAYSGALPVERYMRDGLAGSVMAPTSDVLADLIGKSALGQPLM